ncbi:hypothetical protein [Microbacterium paludicola]|uniref:hypothetical protein n=1 Tax=Microbacterium paludicola TaxID=300019 RepID=UPI00119D1D09|nr:hypothetical protein [Microbacterium paludicola]
MAGYLIGGRLLSGLITIRQVIPRSASIELTLNAAEKIDVGLSLPLVDPATGVVLDVPNQLLPGRDFIGWVENGVVLAAGQIQGDPFTFPGASSIKATGLGDYFDRRYVLPVLGADELPRDVTSAWSGLSLRTIAKRLVQQAMSHPSSGLPVDLEADVAGSHEREYPGSDGMTVWQALENLTNVEGGPDITFRPKLSEDRRHVRWDMLTGSPQLTQGGADHYWDVSAPGPHAAVDSLVRDGRDLASRSFLTGVTLRNMLPNPIALEGLDGYKTGTNATNLRLAGGSPRYGGAYFNWDSVASGSAFLDSERGHRVEPGQTFTFSAHLRNPSGRPMRLMLRFRNAEGDGIMSSYSTAWSDSSWVRRSHTATAPAGAADVTAYIEGQASAAGQSFLAYALMLHESAEALPFAVDELQIQARAENVALLEAGFPLMESWENRSSVLRESTLRAYADESVVRYSAHTETFTLRVKRDQNPKLGTYWPGDWAKVRIGKNPRIPAGTYRVRIVRIAFQAEGDVTIECAPERVAGGYPVPSSKRSWLTDKLRALTARADEQNRG